MNRKQERRLQRHLRNKAKDIKHKEEAWEAGKLIKPNHNGKAYPLEYSLELGRRLVERISQHRQNCNGDNELFKQKFRLYRKKCIEFILHYSQGDKCENYRKIKTALETYWDNPENLINIEL